MIRFTTSLGDFDVELNDQEAPVSSANVLAYVDAGFFDGTLFHRVIPGFMIQGGGMTADLEQKSTHGPVDNEANNGLKNTIGSIAMARTNDPHSATAQFFINVADNGFLDHKAPTPQGWGYAVFGHVTGGMEVIDQIRVVATGNKGYHQDVPVETITIERVSTD